MRLQGRWLRRRRADPPASTATDLDAKDVIVDSLLKSADELVLELRESLGQAMAELRESAKGADDDRR